MSYFSIVVATAVGLEIGEVKIGVGLIRVLILLVVLIVILMLALEVDVFGGEVIDALVV